VNQLAQQLVKGGTSAVMNLGTSMLASIPIVGPMIMMGSSLAPFFRNKGMAVQAAAASATEVKKILNQATETTMELVEQNKKKVEALGEQASTKGDQKGGENAVEEDGQVGGDTELRRGVLEQMANFTEAYAKLDRTAGEDSG
jgi:hypothetical protein